MKSSKPMRSRGLTLIEVIVVIGIIGVLFAILVPAVGAARESVRRTQCINNLRQLAIATSSYASGSGSFPPGRSSNGFSQFVLILSYLDQVHLYNSINFSSEPTSPILIGNTFVSSVFNMFLCPSDPIRRQTLVGSTNYAGNRGEGIQKFGENGAFSMWQCVALQDFGDGLSNTVAYSELVQGPLSGATRDARRSVFATPEKLILPGEFEAFSQACQSLNPNIATINGAVKGEFWTLGDFGFSHYNHTLTPGQNSCTNRSGYQQGAWTAGSFHANGTNAAFCDGHVSVISNNVHLSVWRSVGSRAGGEIVSSNSF